MIAPHFTVLSFSGHPIGLRGAFHDAIHGLLRLRRGAEYRAAVFLHRFKPSFDISRALVEFRLHPDLRAKHAVANLRYQFLECIGLAIIEPAQTVKPLCRPCPVGQLMRQGAVISCSPVKGRDRRHVDAINLDVVIGARLLGRVDLRACRGKERLQLGIGHGAKITGRIGQDVKFSGQAVDLVGVEHAVGLGIRDLAFLAVFVLALNGAVFHDGGGFLTLTYMAPKLLGLIERHPAG